MFLQNAIVSVFSSLNKYIPIISSCDLSTIHLPQQKKRQSQSIEFVVETHSNMSPNRG